MARIEFQHSSRVTRRGCFDTMEQLVIYGGKRLEGTLRIGGAKNAALPLLAATVLTKEPCTIVDVPPLLDVEVMIDILERIGVRVDVGTVDGLRSLHVDPSSLHTTIVPPDLMRLMRSSIFLMGPLLAHYGNVQVSYPGGCAIGPRPIDLHLKGLTLLGAEIKERGGQIYARAKKLRGADIHLDTPSVGATENIMMAAVFAQGKTVLRNAAKEPEIVDLAACLNEMGADIFGAGTDVIEIRGVDHLRGVVHRAIPDRIEAGTMMIAAAITRGVLELTNVRPDHLDAAIAKLREAGCDISIGEESITIRGPETIQPVDLRTQPYPGFPTDLQSQMMAMLTVADGTSIISETIFENRFKVAQDLRRMGAHVTVDGRVAIIRGVHKLTGAHVEAMDDLRGGAALVLAGLAADGETIVDGVQHIRRGYADIEGKLASVGADIHVRTGSECKL